MKSRLQIANRPSISLLEVTLTHPDEILPFIAQPLLSPRGADVFGYEVLYRGTHPTNAQGWTGVDQLLLQYLAKFKMCATLFVNLSNHSILTIDDEQLFAAHANNDIYFEWSEVVAEESQFKKIIQKLNSWTTYGLRFVVDDFGAGRDGFERLFAIECVSGVKFDGGFFRRASINPMARNLVEHVINECAQKQILTVGECIETAADLQLAQELGFNLVQGFYVDDLYALSKIARRA